MTAFFLLSEGAKAVFYSWTVIILIGFIYNTVQAVHARSGLYTALFTVLSIFTYLQFQTEHDLILHSINEGTLAFSVRIGELKWIVWLIEHLLLTVITALLARSRILWEKKHIHPGSIAAALDAMPFGICCYRNNGRVIFSNSLMEELCGQITGKALMNGFELNNSVAEKTITVNGKTWHFEQKCYIYREALVFEIIASDVTGEYAVTQKLISGNEELKRVNGEMRSYNRNIDETIRQREILSAKMTIHDEMNKVMLTSITAAESKDPAKLNEVLGMWSRNMLLFFKNGGEASQHNREEITKLAELLGIKLIWGEFEDDKMSAEMKDVVYKAAREAISNAKHAHAKQMRIIFSETEEDITVYFSNDGTRHKNDTVFGGGLKNLEDSVKKIGGTLSAADTGRFTLILTMPKK